MKEEVGLDAIELKLIYEGRRENPCRREGGSWHFWKLYEVKTEGKVERSLDETKKAVWCDIEYIKKLSARSDSFALGNIANEEWEKDPGLEPTMNDWFKELKII